MSKLYDVINRLEDASVPGKTGFDSGFTAPVQEAERQQAPWIRVLVFAVAFVALGSITVVIAMWGKDRLSRPPVVEAPAAAPPTLQLPVETPLPAVLPSQSAETDHNSTTDVDDIALEAMSIDVADTANTSRTIEHILQTADFEAPALDNPKSSEATTIFIRELDIAEAEPSQEQYQADFATDHTRIDDDKAKTSRWLHQAELYRRSGEWQGAVLLYQRVWDITGDPGVANNLAASLIEMGRFEEALKILDDGSIIAPNDPDIRLNLGIVKDYLERQ